MLHFCKELEIYILSRLFPPKPCLICICFLISSTFQYLQRVELIVSVCCYCWYSEWPRVRNWLHKYLQDWYYSHLAFSCLLCFFYVRLVHPPLTAEKLTLVSFPVIIWLFKQNQHIQLSLLALRDKFFCDQNKIYYYQLWLKANVNVLEVIRIRCVGISMNFCYSTHFYLHPDGYFRWWI